ncbi:MAG TPA: hypothetical protein P5119_10560 [Candidatus Aminicenantes bacterium]|nr:hypothetical protein [Candidatus Aminicenantes bacterium]HRY65766.1 hypothetical protein [Candidatus Aminicenantes bacterium]HRZ72680.1 hypothetical protein [Candidatus Aminicenantes bacterium]
MTNRRPVASRIKTLRVAVRPGTSVVTQLATALSRRVPSRASTISVAGFFFPYCPGFPALAYPGRKAQAPAFGYRQAAS